MVNEMKFPCGSKGRPEFCPSLCQYGKFCKVKHQKVEPSRAADLLKEEKEDSGNVPKVRFYY
ncbi:hypothetical protein KY363_03215 [Candidatus Woesearchaeota archaeon]|nr:hypothetical protein [Candidatus Woesearchaeota archaeon]